jgi:hypothetical protein
MSFPFFGITELRQKDIQIMPSLQAQKRRAYVLRRHYQFPLGINRFPALWEPVRCNSKWGRQIDLAVVHQGRSRASAQAGVISQPRPGQHWGLRPFASMQQSADFFCKETSPERPRLEAPFPLFA